MENNQCASDKEIAISPYTSTKTYGTVTGLSCAFRQWRADTSHCRFIHGYSLGFRFVFGCSDLDARGWVVNFGGLKNLKKLLEENFDHVLAVASDDPDKELIVSLSAAGVAQVKVFEEGVGCERFAKKAFDLASTVLGSEDSAINRWVISAECFEHEGNSAIYTRQP